MIDKQTWTALLNNSVVLTVIDGTVTLDNNWSPYCQADLKIQTPADLTPFDPRQNGDRPPDVVIGAFQEFCYSEPLSTFTSHYGLCSDITAAFGLCSDITAAMVHDLWQNATTPAAVYREFRLAIVDYTPQDDGTTTLQLESLETLLMDGADQLQVAGDAGSLADPYYAATSLRYYLWNKIVRAIYNATVFFGAPNKYDPASSSFDFDLSTLMLATALATPAYSTYWDFINTYVTLAGGRLWCDERTYWHFEKSPSSSPGAVVFDASTSAIKWSAKVSRKTTWYNKVAVIYTWTDNAGVAHTQVDQVQAVTADSNAFRTLVVQMSVPYPGPGAAAVLLARVRSYGNEPTIEAVNDFSISPGQPATITLPFAASPYVGVIGAVSWNIAKAEQSITPRQLV